MPGLLAQVLAYTLLPVAATIAGGAIAAFRTPGPRLRSGVQHFAAGVVFAAVAVELLPDVVHERAPVAAVLGLKTRWAGPQKQTRPNRGRAHGTRCGAI